MSIALRMDFDAANGRRAAKGSKNGPQARRRLALAAIYEGSSRSEAARISGVTVQIVRDWWTARHAEPSRAVQVAVQGLGKVLAGSGVGPVWMRSYGRSKLPCRAVPHMGQSHDRTPVHRPRPDAGRSPRPKERKM